MRAAIVCGCGSWIFGRPRKRGDYIFHIYACKSCGAEYRIKPPRRPLWLAISGSHAYGFARPESDIDWRGAFVRNPREIITLRPTRDMIALSKPDITMYSLLRFGQLLVQGNGNILENLFQPMYIEHSAIRRLQVLVRRDIISKAFYNHYRGYAWQCWLQTKAAKSRALKWPLHTARLLMSGIMLLETGEIETNLLELNKRFNMPLIEQMIAVHRTGKGKIKKSEIFSLEQLFEQLEAAKMRSKLREKPWIRRLDKFIFSTICKL